METVTAQSGRLPERYALFDLDGTIVASVFTNERPLPCMAFYKVGNEGDNRYSVLRPGVPELFSRITGETGYSIAVVTNAKEKRARKILSQFTLEPYVSLLLPREYLCGIREAAGLPAACKPLGLIGGGVLYDDRAEAAEKNGDRCVLVPPFVLRYEVRGGEGALAARTPDGAWTDYDGRFRAAEAERVAGWIAPLLRGAKSASLPPETGSCFRKSML